MPFARRLGALDISLIVIGSVIGSGIFRTPSVVAQRAPNGALILGAWAAGGLVSLFGVFVLGELAARRPDDCGVYVHLRDAFHPIVGFAFGWAALLVALSGGLAAAAIVFAGYLLSLTGLPIAPGIVAAVTLGVLALLNALGVRQGATTQNVLTILKIAALLAVIVGGSIAPAPHRESQLLLGSALGATGAFAAFSIAMIPVMFSYLGAQVANFVAPETRNAARSLPLGLTLGMIGTATIYVLVNAACIRTLGIGGLARTDVPVATLLSQAAGPIGARVASIAVALTTLGFMSNRMLTVPRLYHAMAADGLFFRAVAWVDPRTHVPIVAIMLQAAVAIAIALTSAYAHILNFVVAISYAFGGLLAVALCTFRARDARDGVPGGNRFRAPLHPVSTIAFILASWGVSIATCVAYPRDGLLGLAIVLSAVPVYFIWSRGRVAPRGRA